MKKELIHQAQKIVDEWHNNEVNFEKEIMEGTPKWLELARRITQEAK